MAGVPIDTLSEIANSLTEAKEALQGFTRMGACEVNLWIAQENGPEVGIRATYNANKDDWILEFL